MRIPSHMLYTWIYTHTIANKRFFFFLSKTHNMHIHVSLYTYSIYLCFMYADLICYGYGPCYVLAAGIGDTNMPIYIICFNGKKNSRCYHFRFKIYILLSKNSAGLFGHGASRCLFWNHPN